MNLGSILSRGFVSKDATHRVRTVVCEDLTVK